MWYWLVFSSSTSCGIRWVRPGLKNCKRKTGTAYPSSTCPEIGMLCVGDVIWTDVSEHGSYSRNCPNLWDLSHFKSAWGRISASSQCVSRKTPALARIELTPCDGSHFSPICRRNWPTCTIAMLFPWYATRTEWSQQDITAGSWGKAGGFDLFTLTFAASGWVVHRYKDPGR